MSQALAQSATMLAVSNGVVEWTELEFTDSVKRASERQAKGTTRERHMLNRNKLVTACCADYRAHFAAMYGKTDRLPSAIFTQIEAAVDKHINGLLKLVNTTNSIGYRRSFFHNHKEMEITERVQCTGENKLSLAEQHLGVTIFITSAERRLKELESKPTPDYDREKEVKAQIMRLNVTKAFIEGEIQHQTKLASETAPK